MLNKHESVKGLFWWWPEDNGNKGVTDKWWNAALYNHDTGKPYAAFYELKNFATSTNINQLTHEKETDSDWYSLNGLKHTRKPAEKGVYINNGKTIVIK
jgi:arabinogalactan endo-1,4-beta-galactosidase